MKYIIKPLLLSTAILFFSGCSNDQVKLKPTEPKKEILDQKPNQLAIQKINLHLSQKVRSRINYHTQSELKNILINSLAFYLDQKSLLNKEAKHSIELNLNYTRRFAGENKSFPTSSLAYPDFSYVLFIKNGKKIVYKSQKKDITIDGGYSLNFQEKAGNLRDKRFEVQFINALVKTVIKDIEKFTK